MLVLGIWLCMASPVARECGPEREPRSAPCCPQVRIGAPFFVKSAADFERMNPRGGQVRYQTEQQVRARVCSRGQAHGIMGAWVHEWSMLRMRAQGPCVIRNSRNVSAVVSRPLCQ